MPSVSTTFTTFALENRSGQINGTHLWGTVANAQTSNDARATWGHSGTPLGPYSGYTAYLKGTQLASLVPAGSQIDGIKATIERRKSATGGTTCNDSAVYVVKGGVVQTTQNKAVGTAYTTTDVAVAYGGATDLWGLSWSAADVNGSGFGIAISCAMVQLFEDEQVPEIDSITIEVFYTPAVGGGGAMMLTGIGK